LVKFEMSNARVEILYRVAGANGVVTIGLVRSTGGAAWDHGGSRGVLRSS
jgi:hypothetical protein